PGAPVVDAAGKVISTAGVLQGYAIVFNQLSTPRYDADGNPYKVRIMPGSAQFTDPCFAYFEHLGFQLLGNTAARTVQIMPPDEIGYPVKIYLPQNYIG